MPKRPRTDIPHTGDRQRQTPRFGDQCRSKRDNCDRSSMIETVLSKLEQRLGGRLYARQRLGNCDQRKRDNYN
jgi:hypothetical protein